MYSSTSPARVQGSRWMLLAQLAESLSSQGAGGEEILCALREANRRRCAPALPDSEVVRVVESLRPGVSASEASSSLHTLSAADVLAAATAPGPEWLVEGLLPVAGLSLLVGRPKSGKSTLARALAVAVVQGRSFLGRQVLGGPVLLVTLEDRVRDVAQHLAFLGLRSEDSFHVATMATLAQVAGWVKQHKPVLVVVDTLGRLVRIREVAEYGKVLEALGCVLSLARESSAHLHLLHHSPKGSDLRDVIDAPLGSVAYSGTADVTLRLKRAQDGSRTLASIQRAGEDLPETILALTDTGWPVLTDTRRGCQAQQIAEDCVAFVRGRGSATWEEIREGVKGRAQAKADALQFLLEAGVLKKVGTGRRGDSFKYLVE